MTVRTVSRGLASPEGGKKGERGARVLLLSLLLALTSPPPCTTLDFTLEFPPPPPLRPRPPSFAPRWAGGSGFHGGVKSASWRVGCLTCEKAPRPSPPPKPNLRTLSLSHQACAAYPMINHRCSPCGIYWSASVAPVRFIACEEVAATPLLVVLRRRILLWLSRPQLFRNLRPCRPSRRPPRARSRPRSHPRRHCRRHGPRNPLDVTPTAPSASWWGCRTTCERD
jgi:hypothetical protein